MIERDIDLENYFTGKRIALVAPSPHLVGKGIGKIIDSYDIVCRVNDLPNKSFFEDYGKRTDIEFYNCASMSNDWIIEKLKQEEELYSLIKYIFCPCIRADHEGVDNIFDNYKKINLYNIPFKWIGYNNYNYIYNRVGTEPNAGITALIYLLSYDIKELFITGFSFYAQGQKYEQCYYAGRVEDKYKKDDFNPFLGHNQSVQANYFVNNVLKNNSSRLKIDSFLRDLFMLQYNNVLELT